MTDLVHAFESVDRVLVSKGFPETSPWWRSQIFGFLASGRRRWVIRAGRRAGKSSTLSRLAVVQALFGDWSVPPGDVAVIAFVSVDRDEASARLVTIRSILDALGVEYDASADQIALRSRRVVFRVETCSFRSVGFTAIMVLGDEMSRWESRDTGANPAREVMASLRPTMATQPNAIEICSSSPWSTDDYHAELFDLGTTDHQVASFAPTWLANPTITEARTHELEPDPRAWSREYAAIPGAGIAACFDPEQVHACLGRTFMSQQWGRFCAIDPSSLSGKDGFGVCFASTASDPDGLIVEECAETTTGTVSAVVERIASGCKARSISEVWGDHYAGTYLVEPFRVHGLTYRPITWTQSNKASAVVRLLELVRTGRVGLPANAHDLANEFVAVKEILRPSGSIEYRTSGLDLFSSVLAGVIAHLENGELLWGDGLSPLWRAYAQMDPPLAVRLD